MTAFYNENDPKAAAWLRELIKQGHIAPGVVDERSIEDIRPAELAGFTQCHFFAGIGVWSYALRRAGWPDDRPVWTGSCPCQPFSQAGQARGFDDERHLWPHWFHLIENGKRPGIPVFGEQVESEDGITWLDLVQADMEGLGYAVWPVVLPAAGFGSPNVRHRIYFAAERLGNTNSARTEARLSEKMGWKEGQPEINDDRSDRLLRSGAGRPDAIGMADSDGRDAGAEREQSSGEQRLQPENGSALRENGERARSYIIGMADAKGSGVGAGLRDKESGQQWGLFTSNGFSNDRPSPISGFWRNADWLGCRDGKWRPVEPGTSPLVNGAAARVVRLRGYGNAINAEVARGFIEAYMQI